MLKRKTKQQSSKAVLHSTSLDDISERGRTNITTLLNKKIVKIEVLNSGCNTYYRFHTSLARQRKNFFDVKVNSIFDKHGMFFEDNVEIPFPE